MSPLVLVTGSTGFVGKAVISDLLKRDVRIRLVQRQALDKTLSNQSKIESVIPCEDIFNQDREWWAKICEGVDLVIHLAWYVNPADYLHSPKNSECLQGTLQLVEGAVLAKVRRFAGVGTCFEYSLKTGYLSTATPLEPQSLYASAKVAAYVMTKAICQQAGMEFIWGRLFYLYGENEHSARLVPYIHQQLALNEPVLLTNGEQIRDYQDVNYAATYWLDYVFSSFTGAVNICSGYGITVKALALNIAAQYGRQDLLIFGARPHATNDPDCVVGIRTTNGINSDGE